MQQCSPPGLNQFCHASGRRPSQPRPKEQIPVTKLLEEVTEEAEIVEDGKARNVVVFRQVKLAAAKVGKVQKCLDLTCTFTDLNVCTFPGLPLRPTPRHPRRVLHLLRRDEAFPHLLHLIKGRRRRR